VRGFQEKPPENGASINGCFLVINIDTIDLIDDDQTIWKSGPLNNLATSGQLEAFHHESFWHAMDTLRDKNHLEELWSGQKATYMCWV
jgi:glucose-1-phosphate cytidylyltransferase